MKFGWEVSEALTELLGTRSKSNKKANRARVPKSAPKSIRHFLVFPEASQALFSDPFVSSILIEQITS